MSDVGDLAELDGQQPALQPDDASKQASTAIVTHRGRQAFLSVQDWLQAGFDPGDSEAICASNHSVAGGDGSKALVLVECQG